MGTPSATTPRRRWILWILGSIPLGFVALLLGLLLYRPSPPRVDAARLCALAEGMSRPGGAEALLAELARQTGVRREELRLDSDGAHAPYWTFFVQEAGILVARPGVDVPEDGSFRRIDRCVYAYVDAG